MLDTARTRSQVLILKSVCSLLEDTMLTVVRFALRSTVMVTLAVPGLLDCNATTFRGVKVRGAPSLATLSVLVSICVGGLTCCWVALCISGRIIRAGLTTCEVVLVVVLDTDVVTELMLEDTGTVATFDWNILMGSFFRAACMRPVGIFNRLLGAILTEAVGVVIVVVVAELNILVTLAVTGTWVLLTVDVSAPAMAVVVISLTSSTEDGKKVLKIEDAVAATETGGGIETVE